MRAVYPGSFNPPTVGHIEIVNSAINRFKVNEIHLVMSEIALGKEKLTGPSVSDRVEILEKSLSSIPEASVLKTSKQLIADIAEGYDVVILGADKWKQLTELDHVQRRLKSLKSKMFVLRKSMQLSIVPRICYWKW